MVVNLTTVGENLQDQVNTMLVYSSPTNHTGAGTYLGHPTVADIFGSNTTHVANDVQNNLPAYAAKVSEASNGTMSQSNLLSLFTMQYDIIFNNPTPIAEVLVTPKGESFYSEYWGLMPFSRGNVHIASTDPTQQPTINPNYMMLEFDMQQQIGSAKFVRDIYQTAPMSGSTSGEATPGFTTVPADATDSQWASWINGACEYRLSTLRNYCLCTSARSNFHPVGTTAMMPRDMGGVVDTNLVVYGTSNVRVVDASILPFQVCGHLTSTIYAVAERAADLIKGGKV